MHGLAGQIAALEQQLVQMPRDGLALAVRVGGQIQGFGFAQRFGNSLDVLFVALDNAVAHAEVIGRVDRTFLGDEIAHVAIGGEHLEILTQVFLDGLRLGGRFDDD